MEYLYAAILGIVEGLTEFLPISSTGHLILVGHYTGFESLVGKPVADAFDVIIQLGAILAVVAAYPTRFTNLLRFDRNHGFSGLRGIGLLVITSIPAGVLGVLLHDAIEEKLFHPITVAAALAIGAIWILAIEYFPPHSKSSETANLDTITFREAFAIGCFQCLALWPGMSRSASTILGGILSGVERKTATEYSFFAAVPIMLAATLLKFHKSYAVMHGHFGMLAIGFIVSFIVAWIAVKTFVWFLGRHTLVPFGWYRLALAAVVFWFAFRA